MLISTSAFAAEDCFDSNFVTDWDYNDETETLVINSFDDVYNVKTFTCLELPWANTIGFSSFFGTQVCRGDKVVVVNGFNEIVETCPIISVEKQ